MKHMMMPLVTAIFLLAGCVFESPLTTEHIISIDQAVLGIWEPIPDDEKKAIQNERMMILKYSDTEYLIHYPPGGNDELYYRGYPIKIGDVQCVQLQIIGTADGPPANDVKDLFHIVSYQVTDDSLEIKTLNTELVSDELKTIGELRQAFLKHKNSKNLFIDPGVFRKVKK